MNYDYAYVYILTNFSKTVLYTGVTTNLYQRITDHKNEQGSTFTLKYKVKNLVRLQAFARIKDAIEKEKQIKRWRRSWKEELINKQNPEWKDLYEEIIPFA
ncbi:MAG: GIY-YIG nuclease family protein [Bacteroidota bacterium]